MEKVAALWGQPDATWKREGGKHWLENPAVQRRLNEKASGDPHRDCYQFFLDVLGRHGLSTRCAAPCVPTGSSF
jgi:hypothetical protein